MDNIKLADNKAIGLLQIKPNNPKLIELCLNVIQPNLSLGINPPEDYEIFNAKEIEHVEYQCKLLREIVLYKYKKVEEMIDFISN
jgi:hypothetical protein